MGRSQLDEVDSVFIGDVDCGEVGFGSSLRIDDQFASRYERQEETCNSEIEGKGSEQGELESPSLCLGAFRPEDVIG